MIWETEAPLRENRNKNHIYVLSREVTQKLLRVKLSFDKNDIIDAMKKLMLFRTEEDFKLVTEEELKQYKFPDCINMIPIEQNKSKKLYMIPNTIFKNALFYYLNDIYNNNCYICSDLFRQLNDTFLLYKYNNSTYNINDIDAEIKLKIIEELLSHVKIEKDIVCDYNDLEKAARLLDEVAYYENISFDSDKLSKLKTEAVLNIEKFKELNIDVNKESEKIYQK